jgi:hypothetical protein
MMLIATYMARGGSGSGSGTCFMNGSGLWHTITRISPWEIRRLCRDEEGVDLLHR